jgi:hypothetical protein
MFKRHVINELDYSVIPQKESSWKTDLTVKKLFENNGIS